MKLLDWLKGHPRPKVEPTTISALVDDLVGRYRPPEAVLTTRREPSRADPRVAPQFLPKGCRAFLHGPSDSSRGASVVLLFDDGGWTAVGDWCARDALALLEWETSRLVAAGLVSQEAAPHVRVEAERRNNDQGHARVLRAYREEPVNPEALRVEVAKLEDAARCAVEVYEAARQRLAGLDGEVAP